MKYSNKKFVVLVFIVLILLLAVPKPASAAAVSVFETNPILVGKQTILQTITSVATDITGAATLASKIQMFFEWAFKLAAEALKRQLLNMIVDQIVQWIQGGGTPKFITNWPGFFQDAVDQAGGRFLQQLGLGRLCSAFGLQLSAALIPIPTFAERSSCTMSQVGANLDAFLNNFQNGGWIAWNQMVLNPQNNIYGAYLMAWDQYNIETSAAAKAAAAEAQAGKGFLGVKRCLQVDSVSYNDCITAPGATPEACQKGSCTKYETVTPGSVVGDLASKAVGSDIDYIVNAQDFAAYVAAITNAILNRMFKEGVGLLHSALSSSSGGGGGGGGNCTDTSWSPDQSMVCSSQSFTQYSNCGNARQTTGTKNCGGGGTGPGTGTQADPYKLSNYQYCMGSNRYTVSWATYDHCSFTRPAVGQTKYFSVDPKGTTGISYDRVDLDIKTYNDPDLEFAYWIVDKATGNILNQVDFSPALSIEYRFEDTDDYDIDNVIYIIGVKNTGQSGIPDTYPSPEMGWNGLSSSRQCIDFLGGFCNAGTSEICHTLGPDCHVVSNRRCEEGYSCCSCTPE